MTIIGNGKRYFQTDFANEEDFEGDIVSSSKMLFGKSTIYINAKKKLDSKSLGGTIPDGFFFDLSDPTDPQFYIVEVELSKHDFFKHIFPQITRFFAFYKNTKLQKSLVDRLFSLVNNDEVLKSEFKKWLGPIEIYKFLSDIIETSQNILLVADGQLSELPEIMDTYTDTWGKMVKYLVIRKYLSGSDTIYTITPEFESLQYEGGDEAETEEDTDEPAKFGEAYHLDGVGATSSDAYYRIKEIVGSIDSGLVFNPQKYYISIKAGKNIAFLKIRAKKVRFIAMMPESEIRKRVKSYPVATISAPVQKFYNGPCAAIDITNTEHMDEIATLIRAMVDYNKAQQA